MSCSCLQTRIEATARTTRTACRLVFGTFRRSRLALSCAYDSLDVRTVCSSKPASFACAQTLVDQTSRASTFRSTTLYHRVSAASYSLVYSVRSIDVECWKQPVPFLKPSERLLLNIRSFCVSENTSMFLYSFNLLRLVHTSLLFIKETLYACLHAGRNVIFRKIMQSSRWTVLHNANLAIALMYCSWCDKVVKIPQVFLRIIRFEFSPFS